jgi:hypothetical protein
MRFMAESISKNNAYHAYTISAPNLSKAIYKAIEEENWLTKRLLLKEIIVGKKGALQLTLYNR